MLLGALGITYLGYALFFYGVEYALGVPLTFGDAVLPWKINVLKNAETWAAARKSGGKPASSQPTTAPRAPGQTYPYPGSTIK